MEQEMIEEVVLVNENDEELGTMEKLEAHRRGKLHRAFSVFIFNTSGKMLLQRRAFDKYHSAGLWTNTCCSHPRPGEAVKSAAQRRLMEEMGLNTPLAYKTSFVYKASFDNDLTEHEYDHVFTGITDANPVINLNEVESFKWLDVDELRAIIRANPGDYTVWFRIAMEKLF